MGMDDEIKKLIPHREPFLFVDKIVSLENGTLITENTFPEDSAFYQGHYPGSPITPGVILSEAIFQSGALLIAKTAEPGEIENGVPVLTRITGAKYKRSVYPGDTVTISVSLIEKIANAWFMKGTLKVSGRMAVQIEFGCTLA